MIDFEQRPLQKNIKPGIRPEKTVSRMIDGFIMPFFGLFNKWRRCKNMENNILVWDTHTKSLDPGLSTSPNSENTTLCAYGSTKTAQMQ